MSMAGDIATEATQLLPRGDSPLRNNSSLGRFRLFSHKRKTLISRTIENRGSAARDFYAIERNYLSWFRIGLVMAGLGMTSMSADFNSKSARFSRSCNGGIEGQLYWIKVFSRHRELGCLAFFAAFVIIAAAVYSFGRAQRKLAFERRPLTWSVKLPLATGFLLITAVFSFFVSCSI